MTKALIFIIFTLQQQFWKKVFLFSFLIHGDMNHIWSNMYSSSENTKATVTKLSNMTNYHLFLLEYYFFWLIIALCLLDCSSFLTEVLCLCVEWENTVKTEGHPGSVSIPFVYIFVLQKYRIGAQHWQSLKSKMNRIVVQNSPIGTSLVIKTIYSN